MIIILVIAAVILFGTIMFQSDRLKKLENELDGATAKYNVLRESRQDEVIAANKQVADYQESLKKLNGRVGELVLESSRKDAEIEKLKSDLDSLLTPTPTAGKRRGRPAKTPKVNPDGNDSE